MAKVKYRFNPHTLQFDKIAIPLSKRIAKIAIHFVLSLMVVTILTLAYSFFFDTPKEKMLKREIGEILSKYDLLKAKIKGTDAILTEIQKRDNNIYRAIFEADTIPTAYREGGYGGANKYAALEKFENADILINTSVLIDQITWKVYVQSKSFDDVIVLAKNKDRMNECMPAIQPVSVKEMVRISDGYGYRTDPFTRVRTMHCGVDFTGPVGVPVYATGDGVVIEAGYSFNGYGNQIIIDHGFGYKTRYAHLKKLNVNIGVNVKRGEIIGALGNSGKSTGPHLHYEVYYRDKSTDPMNYFNDISSEEYDEMIKNATSRQLEDYSFSDE